MLTSIAILDSGARAVSAPRNDLTGRRFYTGTWYLRSRGYEVDTESLVAYYDGNTRRCRVLERMGRDPGRGHYFDFKEKGA